MSADDQYIITQDNTFPPLPFDVSLSLEPIFRFWEDKALYGTSPEQIHAKSILDNVAHLPVLRSPIGDLQMVEEYGKEIGLLLSAIFPDMLSATEAKSASLPFLPVLFNGSEKLKSIFTKAGPDYVIRLKNFTEDELYRFACARVIESIYNVPVDFKHPRKVDIPDLEQGIMRHFKAVTMNDFSAIRPKENTVPLSADDIRLLLNHSDDMALWRKLIPPGAYTYEGIHIVTFFDQTQEESLSELKRLLLESNALQDHAILDQVERQLAQYLNIQKFDLGFDAFDENGCVVRALHGSATSSKLLKDSFESSIDDWFCDPSFDGLLKRDEVYAISNAADMKSSSSVFVKRMYEKGIGSFLIAPLKFNNQIIAFIELTSDREGVLNAMVGEKLKNVLPMFSMVVGRTIDIHQMQLDAIIQDKFTSLHPTVNWKFLKAAEAIFQQELTGIPGEADIVFQDVYPLYGQFDIRGSSDTRNATILADLREQLDLAAQVLEQALALQRLPIYQQLFFRLNQYRDSLGLSLHASDEVKIIDFMRRELDPAFKYLRTQEDLREIVGRYISALDPKLGVIYKERKEYDQSVNIINERISEYINQQQVLAQGMFPHYFDKFKTDGVEYNAFIGQSLVQSRLLDPIHLKNLRLWQLLVVCGVENIHQSYKDELPMNLDIASLILVYSNPMAIRFKIDERRFDVDGAYNARYEILKKRIDKAHIKGTGERLTQPGKLSIVYTQDWEADEYLEYIKYLQSCNYLDTNIESVGLEDLQGATGLQAFRIAFKYEESPDELIREMMREVVA
jgi:hypothetical protein